MYLVRGRVERGRVSYEALSAFGLNFGSIDGTEGDRQWPFSVGS